MKKCELCKSQARIYCDSDQASLCWTCDARVHSANFLVARHSRSLLCHLCRNPTPWTASGEKLGRTVSICEPCVHAHRDNHDDDEEEEEIDTDGEYEEEEEVDDDGIDVENNEEGDNQVVPWSSSKSPPPTASSSISEECSSRFCNDGGEVSSKRMDVADLHSNQDDDLRCSSSEQTKRTAATVAPTTGVGESDISDSFSLRPSKIRKLEIEPAAMVSRSPESCGGVRI